MYLLNVILKFGLIEFVIFCITKRLLFSRNPYTIKLNNSVNPLTYELPTVVSSHKSLQT